MHTHHPIMLHEILSYAELHSSPQWMLDATFGRGGHTQAFLKKWPGLKVIALDQDPEAYEYGKKHFEAHKNFHIYHQNFHTLSCANFIKEHPIEKGFDFILLDLGVSSPQLDNPERGFSFYQNGPLDMRMNSQQKETAATIINTWDDKKLFELFTKYGEIKNPRKVIHEIITQRKKQPITQTLQLAKMIEKTHGWKKKGQHPATLYFLALRIYVNNELDGLAEALPSLIEFLANRGRIFVLTFHSSEDRIVKQVFKEYALKLKEGILVNKKVIRPSRGESLSNPRSRSAKLRIFERLNHV